MPRLLLLRLGVGADEVEDPVAVLAERGPGLLAVDDVLVAVADRCAAQPGEVGAGVGLGEALRPPDVEVGGLGQERLLLLLGAVGGDDRADHGGVEGQRQRDAGALHLLVPDVALERGPVLAAPLDGPARDGEAGLVEDALALDDLLLGELLAGRDGVPDLLGHLGGEEGAHLLAERGVLRRQLQPHATPRSIGGGACPHPASSPQETSRSDSAQERSCNPPSLTSRIGLLPKRRLLQRRNVQPRRPLRRARTKSKVRVSPLWATARATAGSGNEMPETRSGHSRSLVHDGSPGWAS